MKINKAVFTMVSLAIFSVGFAPFSFAGVVSSDEFISAEVRGERITKIEAMLTRIEVAGQLEKLGVSPDMVMQRVQNMTNEELLLLEDRIDEEIAGAGLIGVIGVVFVVLLILELVGVTDVFKSI